MIRSARAATTLAVLSALVLGAFVLRPTTEQSRPVSLSLIQAPTQVTAGTDFVVSVLVDESGSGQVPVWVIDATATIELSVPFEDHRGEIAVGSPLTDHAGLLTFVAGPGAHERHDVMIVPGPAAGVVTPLIGPRTIIADAADRTLAVVVPTDELGNAVSAGTEVTTRVRTPSGDRTEQQTETSHLLAYSWITSTTDAGIVAVSAASGTATGRTIEFDQVAGRPGAFEIRDNGLPLIADGRTLHEISTTELRDRYGNLLPDGMAVTFTVDASEGRRIVPATVIDGIAAAVLEAPTAPGPLVVSATLAGVDGAPATLDFGPAVSDLPFVTDVLPDGYEVRVGPVLDVDGGHVPDDTTVVVNGRTTTLRDGSAMILLEPADVADQTVTVEVLGVAATLEVSR